MVQRIPNGGWDERILAFQFERIVSAFAVISRRYVVLIDTLVNADAARAMLDHLRDALDQHRKLLVINTHADWDHAWGNALFSGVDAEVTAPIIGHRVCRERMLGQDEQRVLAHKQQQEPERYAGVRLQPPTVTFDTTLLIDGDDLQFELFHTPGHTPDHIAVYVPQLATLFAGDAAERPLPFVDTAATLPQLRASLAHLRALQPDTALYCHAHGVYNASVINANIAYFDTLEQRCRAALLSGAIVVDIDKNYNVDELIDYRLDQVDATSELDATEVQFYRDAHQQAIRAMLEYVRLPA